MLSTSTREGSPGSFGSCDRFRSGCSDLGTSRGELSELFRGAYCTGRVSRVTTTLIRSFVDRLDDESSLRGTTIAITRKVGNCDANGEKE